MCTPNSGATSRLSLPISHLIPFSCTRSSRSSPCGTCWPSLSPAFCWRSPDTTHTSTSFFRRDLPRPNLFFEVCECKVDSRESQYKNERRDIEPEARLRYGADEYSVCEYDSEKKQREKRFPGAGGCHIRDEYNGAHEKRQTSETLDKLWKLRKHRAEKCPPLSTEQQIRVIH